MSINKQGIWKTQKFINNYKVLDYIESTGASSIDTGYYWHTENTRIQAVVTVIRNPSNQSLWGNEEYYNASARYFAGIPHGTNGNYNLYIGTGTNGAISLSLNTKHEVDIQTADKKINAWVDGTKSINDRTYSGTVLTHDNCYKTSEVSTNVGNIFIFANHNSNKGVTNAPTQLISDMKLYSFKMWDNDIMVRHFIPVMQLTDSKVGLYDIINDKFYTGYDNTTFLAPNEFKEGLKIFKEGTLVNDFYEL